MTKSDWNLAHAELTREPSRWGSLSWISAKALLDSVNHGLDRFSDGLVPQLRRHWVATTPAPPLRILERGDVTTFFVVGDTGEQDASQYVVCPSLSAAVREHRPGFVMIASDVIYPAGDVDDYRDGVYRPYRSTDPHFHVEAPLLGLPGNHDWYDGLAGFMYHFADRDEPPAAAYAPQGRGGRAWFGRLSRILWRRARPAGPATRQLRDRNRRDGVHPLTGTMAQPGPYYAVRTRHLLLVAIDTGIDGTIDQEQYAWLREVSELDEPKVLVTGKPLLVNGRLEEGWVDRRPEPAERDQAPSVWKVVQNPEHRYLATIGGDVHNFQQYRPLEKDADGPALHLVSGGGGAFVHATHTYANADHDSRVRNNPHDPFYTLPERSFPSRDESFTHFAALLVPGVLRLLGNLMLFGAGVLAGSLGLWLGPVYSRAATVAALVAVALLVLVRVARTRATRTSALARNVVRVGSFAVGLLAASAALQLDRADYPVFLAAWVGFTLFHCLAGSLVRRARWWRPADESAQNPSWPAFGAALLLLSALAYGLLLGRPALALSLPALAGAALVLAVGWAGYLARRRRFTAPGVGRPDEATQQQLGRQNRRWHFWGALLVPLVQAVVIGIGLHQVAVRVGRPELFFGALGGLGLLLVSTALVLVALVGLTELGTVVGQRVRRTTYAEAWGAVSAATHYAPIPLLALALAASVGMVDSPTGRVAVGLPLVVFSVGSYLVFAVWLRRRVGRAYLLAAVGLPVAALVAGYLADPWWVRVALATAIVLVALGVSIALGHLFFLGAPLLPLIPGGLAPPTFTAEQIETIYAARRLRPARPPQVPAAARFWARLTAPDLGEPGGLLQQKVAEIFSSDRPPFHKSFLRLEADATELQITLHQAFGELPATTSPVGTVPLAKGRVHHGRG